MSQKSGSWGVVLSLKLKAWFLFVFFFRGKRFRWKRKKGQDKGEGEEKRSIFNVPHKWGKREKKQKERFHLLFYLTFHIRLLPQIKCWHCVFFLCIYWSKRSLSFLKISLVAAKSDSDDSEEETQSTKSKKKSGAGSASMFQTSGEKDKEKKTKKKGKLTDKFMLWLSHWNVSDFCWTFQERLERVRTLHQRKKTKQKRKKAKGRRKKYG